MPPGTSLDTLLSTFATAAAGTLRRDLPQQRRPDAQHTEAIVQEVRTRLWKAHPTGEGLSAITAPYFLHLVTTATVDQLRRHALQGNAPQAHARRTAEGAAPAPLSVPVSATVADDAARLRARLRGLPPAQRLAVLLHLEGYGADDMAVVTGWSPARVSAALVDAVGVLREALESFEGARVSTPITAVGTLASADMQHLRAAWQQCRTPVPSSEAVDLVLESEPTTPPEPAAIAAALNGTVSDDDRVRTLDRALHCGGADDLALLHFMRAAAQTAVPSTGNTPVAPLVRAVATPSAARSGTTAGTTPRTGLLALGGVLVVAALVYGVTRSAGEGDAMPATGPAAAAAVAPVLVQPTAGTPVTQSFRLVWRASPGATSYVAELVDGAGARVTSVATADTTVQVTLENLEDMQRVAGWAVTATFAGARTARSETQALTPAR